MKKLTQSEKKTLVDGVDALIARQDAIIRSCQQCTQPDDSVDEDESAARVEKERLLSFKEKLLSMWTYKKQIITTTWEDVWR